MRGKEVLRSPEVESYLYRKVSKRLQQILNMLIKTQLITLEQCGELSKSLKSKATALSVGEKMKQLLFDKPLIVSPFWLSSIKSVSFKQEDESSDLDKCSFLLLDNN